MEITILGCGDAFGSGGRLQTSFFVRTTQCQLLLDCGASILSALQRHKISSAAIDLIIITHFHGDHYGGIPYFLLEAAKLHKRQKPLTFISPPGLKEKLEQLLPLLYPGTADVLDAFPLKFITYQQEKKVVVQGVQVEAWTVNHSPDSMPHGIRLSADGSVLAFSGDTGWHQNLVAISQQADLFICECNLWEGTGAGHMSWEVLQQKLGTLSAKEIRLTHVGEQVLENQQELSLQVLADGDYIKL